MEISTLCINKLMNSSLKLSTLRNSISKAAYPLTHWKQIRGSFQVIKKVPP